MSRHFHKPIRGADFAAGYFHGRRLVMQFCGCGAYRYYALTGWRIQRGAWIDGQDDRAERMPRT